jgi:hypothetical protein
MRLKVSESNHGGGAFGLFEARMSEATWCVLKSRYKSSSQTYDFMSCLLAQMALKPHLARH